MEITCPTCSQVVSVLIDPAMIGQSYIEDCSVCCRAMVLTVANEDKSVSVTANRENE